MEGPLKPARPRRIVALLCRTSDRGPEGARGAAELAELLDARSIGSLSDPHDGAFREDLRDSHGCLLEAGGQIDDALDAGEVPVLLAGDCSIAISTLPVIARHRPDAHVLWIDAHGDFNTPATTSSDYLGGMSLAGACGLWNTGFEGAVDPARVVMHGVRDVQGGERVALDTRGVHVIGDARPLAGHAVFVHLDLDVLDPQVMPARFPAPGGLTPTALRRLLADVAGTCEIVGAEVTSHVPGHSEMAADVIAPLLA
ncbi:MAG: arginase family protein [Solirubrobacterales bacterium]|nr:arginase family protein [Solirubrobacterales bacterium]